MNRVFAAIGLLLFLTPVSPAQSGFRDVSVPEEGGKRFVEDLPVSLHMKNVGGSDGAGLCVFTSIELAGRHQGCETVYGLQKYMTRVPGGGYPQKVDKVLADFGKGKVNYVQHTGGDETFLELALRTGRPVSVTYSGRDNFYSGPVAHMVNLSYLDAQIGVIQDNNRPGKWTVMSRADFLTRWKDRSMGGGWAVVLTDPPAPPFPGGVSPGPTPAPPIVPPDPVPPPTPRRPRPCPGPCPGYAEAVEEGREQAVPIVTWVGVYPSHEVPGTVTGFAESFADSRAGDIWVSVWVGEKHLGRKLDPRFVTHTDKVFAVAEGLGWRPVKLIGAEYPTGVDPNGFDGRTHYWHRGKEVTREQAFRAVGGDTLPDDSAKWFLCFHGDPAARSAFTAGVASNGLGGFTPKLHVVTYPDTAWQVSDRMGGVVSLHKNGATGGSRVWEAATLDWPTVVDKVKTYLDPNYRPAPAPGPNPRPLPDPMPGPAPKTPVDGSHAALALAAWGLYRLEKWRK